LFEVSERSERCELCNAPMTRAPQAAPDAAGRRGRGNRGRLLLAYVLLARQEKVGRRAGATTPPRNVVQTQASATNQPPQESSRGWVWPRNVAQCGVRIIERCRRPNGQRFSVLARRLRLARRTRL